MVRILPVAVISQSVRLDEEFVRGAAVREPSHRDRRRQALRARWDDRRASITRRLPTLPRPGRATAITVTAALVVALAAGLFLFNRSAGGGNDSGESGQFQVAAGSALAVSPFANTSAAAFPDNQAGLTTPAPVALHPFTADEVDAALRHTRRLLATANLDPDVVVGGDVIPVARLLGPTTAARLETAADRPTSDLTASAFLTRFPEGTELVGPVIKVSGATTVAGVDRDRLRVATEHLYVYPTRPSGAPDTPPVLTLVRRSHVWEYARTTGGVGPPELVGGHGTASSGQCIENDLGYVWPPFLPAPGYEDPNTVAAPDLWDINVPVPVQRGCPA